MSERVVDLLEAIEVEESTAARPPLRLTSDEHVLDAVGEEPAVRQPGQAVVQREMLDLVDVRPELPRRPTKHGTNDTNSASRSHFEQRRDREERGSDRACDGPVVARRDERTRSAASEGDRDDLLERSPVMPVEPSPIQRASRSSRSAAPGVLHRCRVSAIRSMPDPSNTRRRPCE